MLDSELGCARSDLPSARPRDTLHPHLVLLLGAVVSCTANYCFEQSELDTCFQSIWTVLEKGQLSFLPSTKEEMDNVCKTFKNGMSCVDNYATNCLPPDKKNNFEQMVMGARITANYLCDNEHFQKEYFDHAKCYTKISKELDACLDKMKEIIKAQYYHDKTELVKNICCAKYEFITCTDRVSRQTCDKDATDFLRKITESLSSNVINNDCRDVTPFPCRTVSKASARSSSHRPRPWPVLFVILCLSTYLLMT